MARIMLELSDTTANDQDMLFTVPAGLGYKLFYGIVSFTSTADVGNRQLELIIRDENNAVVYTISAGAVQAASLTYDYLLTPGGTREGTVVNGELVVPLPNEVLLLPGWDIRVFESAGIEALDDMTVRLLVEELIDL